MKPDIHPSRLALRQRFPFLFAVCLVCLAALASLPRLARAVNGITSITVTGMPVAPKSPSDTGLCASYSFDDGTLQGDLAKGMQSTFQGVTLFTDDQLAKQKRPDPNTMTLGVRLDQSNHPQLPSAPLSTGDFPGAEDAPGCFKDPASGCEFPGVSTGGETSKSFGVRYRGYLQVPQEWMGKQILFGFYGYYVAFYIFDAAGKSYPVIDQPRTGPTQSWRTIHSVTFLHPGPYPVELDFADITNGKGLAALEVSVLTTGAVPPYVAAAINAGRSLGVDGEEASNATDPMDPLSAQGFNVLLSSLFFQFLHQPAANTAFPISGQCEQCPRKYAGLTGGNPTSDRGCADGRFCNSAALCEPCGADPDHCGPTCQVCSFPNKCVQNGHGIFECSQCDTDDRCAGNSCNCCPKTSADTVLDPALPPNQQRCRPATNKLGTSYACFECATDAQCKAPKKCDQGTHRCADQVGAGGTPGCGPQGVSCPDDRPFCLDGKVCVKCVSDLDCQDPSRPAGSGLYCLSGDCAPCTSDRHCTAACQACPGATPFCDSNGDATSSFCVRCTDDSQCPGGMCQKDHTCTGDSPAMSCGPDKKSLPTYAFGNQCVECFTAAQCPCGTTCDVATHMCINGCLDTTDCNGDQCCDKVNNQCNTGRCEANTGILCCNGTVVAPGRPDAALSGGRGRDAALVVMALAVLALLRLRRGLRGVPRRVG